MVQQGPSIFKTEYLPSPETHPEASTRVQGHMWHPDCHPKGCFHAWHNEYLLNYLVVQEDEKIENNEKQEATENIKVLPVDLGLDPKSTAYLQAYSL